MRNWHPFLHETLARDGGAGRRGARSASSCRRCAPRRRGSATCTDVAEAAGARRRGAPEVGFAPPWFEHPRFVDAVADRAAAALAEIPAGRAGVDAAGLHRAQRARRDGRGLAVRRRLDRGGPRGRRATRPRAVVGRLPEPERQPARAVARARRRRRAPRAWPRRASAHVVVVPDRLRLRSRRGALRPRRRGACERAEPLGLALHRAGGRERPSRLHRDAGRPRPQARRSAARRHDAAEARRRRRRHRRARGGAPRGRAGARAGRRVELDAARGRATGSAAPSRPSAPTDSSSRRAPTRSSPRSRGRSRSAGASASRTGSSGTDDRFRRTFVVARRAPASAARRLPAPGADDAHGRSLTLALFSWRGKLRMAPRPRPAARAATRRREPRRASCGAGSAARRSSAWPSRWSAGIYTADPDDLSLAATMPRFRELERRERSRHPRASGAPRRRAPQAGHERRALEPLRDASRTAWRSWSPRWRRACPPGAVRLKHAWTGSRAPRATAGVVLGGRGAAVEADRVIVAAESYHARAGCCATSIRRLATLLGEIPYASSAT